MSTQLGRNPIVRTYRGRSLEELIPRIRAELGPDAIILREREGVTGGINGFFAQRCVEVDAQAPSSVDFYDEEDDALPGPSTAPAAADPYTVSGASAPAESSEEPEGRVAAAVLPEPDELASDAEAAGELSFAQRLAMARRERGERAPATVPAAGSATPGRAGPPTVSPEDIIGASAVPTATAQGPTPDPFRAANVRAKLRVRPRSPRPAGLPPEPPAAAAPLPTPSAEAAERPVPPPASEDDPGVRPAAQLDASAAGAVARDLIAHGISEAWAHELIVTAAAHLTPFAADGRLRDGVRAALAAGLPTAPLLPGAGAAVAFVGAGGAGKTRCATAMAAAYARASTLRVNIITLGGGERAADADALLEGRGISVRAVRGDAAADAVAGGREHGLVVVDTFATSPVDSAGVAELATELGRMNLDAVYLAVPATVSAAAARSLLDGLAPVGPTALAITHADETDALGIATELSYGSGLPVAFVHGGLDLDALRPADPAVIAARVLP